MAKESKAQLIIYNILNPFIMLMHKMGVTPNMITSIGLMINIIAAIIFIIGAEQADRTDMFYIGWGGFTILIAGLFDMMDGRLARIANLSSSYGAFYDSVIDRYSELVMFLGICYYLISHDYFISSLFAFVALIGSMMVSYTRARAESLGINCSVGMMQRPARVVTIGAAAMFCGIIYFFTDHFLFPLFNTYFNFESISIFVIPIFFVSIMSNLTAIQRLIYVKVELNKREGE
jgi:phosphatidylglycerophosphate synthase